MPTLIENPDLTRLKELVTEYMGRVHEEDITSDELSDYDDWICEAAVEAYYGMGVWGEINPILEGL